MSGTVTGLSGTSLVLQLSTGATYEVAADGEFTFPEEIAEGTTYEITVANHPVGDDQNQICVVENGTGTVTDAVVNISVTCIDSQQVGGTVTGLADGVVLVLQNNGADSLTITANGAFDFATEVAEDADYLVTVATQPTTPNQVCTVVNATGTVAEDTPITDIAVTCVNSYTVGGTVSGLVGSGLILQNNATNDIAITEDGNFTFNTALVDADSYEVTIATSPTTPTQTCIVTNGSGVISSTDITEVSVVCTINKYSFGGEVNNLVGSGLVLQNNAGDDLAIAADGSFTFATTIDDLSTYAITVAAQPITPR